MTTLKEITEDDQREMGAWIEEFIRTHCRFSAKSMYRCYMFEKRVQHPRISYVIAGKLRKMKREGKIELVTRKIWESKVYKEVGV